MSSFWLTKKVLLEALKMSEGAPQSTMICFEGSSEGQGDAEKTVTKISVCGKTKTIKDNFQKLLLANPGV